MAQVNPILSIERMLLLNGAGIGAMMANALDVNGAKKVFILGRRLEKLREVASQAVIYLYMAV